MRQGVATKRQLHNAQLAPRTVRRIRMQSPQRPGFAVLRGPRPSADKAANRAPRFR